MGDFGKKLVLGAALLAACGQVKDPNAQTDARPMVDAEIDAPPSTKIAITPEVPRTLDDLVASVTEGPAPATPTWRWSLDGTERTDLLTETVANDQTTKGQVWKVELLDGTEVKASAEVTIANSPPTAPTVTYSAAAPTASLPFRCLATGSVDDDGDAVTYSATWTQNGNAFASTSTTTFPADTIGGAFTKVNDVFRCTVTASDGTDSTVADAGDAAAMACRVYGTTQTLNANGTAPNGTLQTFTIPAGVCSVRIEVAGGKGGLAQGSATNTNGARMIGTFTVTEGDTLKVLVGQAAAGTTPLAGGGGTFVTTMANAPLIIAGGGGSSGCFAATCTITDAETMGRIVTSGGTAVTSAGVPIVARATGGAGGNINAGALCGGGGGLTTNGAGPGGGFAFVNGGAGANANDTQGVGGYGGGGARAGSFGEGGGGGYSGGSCGNTSGTWAGCGGGGSINNGVNQSNTAGINAGAGYARFTY